MANWNTIHIFGYGETQIIGEDINKKVSSSSLTKAIQVVSMVYDTKPQDVVCSIDYNVVTIYNGRYSDFQPKPRGEQGFTTDYLFLSQSLINGLVSEIEAQP